jgi:hypothetical protein
MFRRQFETLAEYNCWKRQEKSTYKFTTLQDRATNILHEAPIGATYENTLGALVNLFWEQQLAAAHCSQLKTRTHDVGDPLQEYPTAVEQLVPRYSLVLPEDYIRREAGKAFADGIEDPDI